MTGTVPSGIDEIDLLPGSHVCAFYQGDSDRDRLLGDRGGGGDGFLDIAGAALVFMDDEPFSVTGGHTRPVLQVET